MKIFEAATRIGRKGPADWFTGDVTVNPVIGEAVAPSRLQSAVVTFAPGARTHWHTHPVGQTLYVLSGIGWAQKKGETARPLAAGDVVVFAPEEVHWHGASAGSELVHLAMQEMDEAGKVVDWGVPVTDVEYPAG